MDALASGSLRIEPDRYEPVSGSIDIHDYLQGRWKRNLEWREFGGKFQHLRTSNTFVLIENARSSERDPSSKFLRWSFWRGSEQSGREASLKYEMKLTQPPRVKDTYMEFLYSGTLCHGRFLPSTNTAILNLLLPRSAIIVTYAIQDENTVSVCIVESGRGQTPTLQYGNMHRILPQD